MLQEHHWMTFASKTPRNRTGPFRRLATECLEQRNLLTTTLFLDFGIGIGMGNMLSTTIGAFRNVDGPGIHGDGTGSDLTSRMDADDSLDLAPLAYDFDGNGFLDNNDITALTNAVLPVVQRALEPFDIDIQVGNASSLADIVGAFAMNDGDPTGEFDAYSLVVDASSDGFGGGSVGDWVHDNTGLYGIAAADDLFAQAGNTQDEATLTFSDTILADTRGTMGTAQFNQNLATRLAYTATHEAFHTFTYVHTVNLPSSGDIIRLGSNTREDPFIVTRFDLARQGDYPVDELNNYLQAANDPDIGLRDSNNDGVPDLAYVTGTGAHDQISLTDAGGDAVNVTVDAYNDTARTALIASEAYTIDLLTDTEGEVLVDASINADSVVVDGTINTNFRLRGGTGLDGAPREADVLTLQSNGLLGSYVPGASGGGTVRYTGGANIEFSEFENVQASGIPIDVLPLTLSNSVLDEGNTLTLNAEFTNIDTLDTHRVRINWGDGSSDTVFDISAGQRTFERSHRYRDDNPTGTPSDRYGITVTVMDEDDGVGSAEAVVTVHNVAPVIHDMWSSATFANKAEEGEFVWIDAFFTDAGVLDTHTATVNWGETGGSDEPAWVLEGGGFGMVWAEHVYDAGGVYTVTVTLTDDDTGQAVSTTQAVIVGAGVNHGVLQIVGGDEDNVVRVTDDEAGQFTVEADFFPEADARTFGPGGIDQIQVWLCDGDDRLDMYEVRSFTGPVIARGGSGNDVIYGSAGNDILLGGAGNDIIFSSLGDNVVIGGSGADRIYGSVGEDLLIAGTTLYDDNDEALLAIAAEWTSGKNYAERIGNITGEDALVDRLNEDFYFTKGTTVFDDGARDVVYGGLGRDWFFADSLEDQVLVLWNERMN